MRTKTLLLMLLLLLLPSAAARADDEVLRWNRVATDQTAAAQIDPLTESRLLAIVQIAVSDAVNAAAAQDVNAASAAASAAHGALVQLLPTRKETFDRELEASLGALPQGKASETGAALGRAAARAVLAARSGDGAERAVRVAPGTRPGEYRPTPPDLTPAFMAQWGSIKPFALASASQFRPGPPPAVDGERARSEMELLRAIGPEKGSVRNDEQSEIARFWYESSPLGWNRIARVVAAQRGLDLQENARLLALVNVAMADGFIAGFEAKYHYNYWRPVTAIREAGFGDWLPYLQTPPVPDYPSTHTVLGAAAATVLARFFGTDYVPFETTSGAPYGGITRRFWSFSEAARENGASRVFAGIHFPTAVEEGYDLGTKVGAWVYEHGGRSATAISQR